MSSFNTNFVVSNTTSSTYSSYDGSALGSGSRSRALVSAKLGSQDASPPLYVVTTRVVGSPSLGCLQRDAKSVFPFTVPNTGFTVLFSEFSALTGTVGYSFTLMATAWDALGRSLDTRVQLVFFVDMGNVSN